MANTNLAQAGTFCPNINRPSYGQVNAGNLINYGHNNAGTQRRKCKTCGKPFAVTRGTIFYRCRTPRKEILEALAMLAERMSISAVARVKKSKRKPFRTGFGQLLSMLKQ